MKALVIAGNSFVGRHLCRRLHDSGIDVVATGRGTEVGFCDISDRDQVRNLVRQVAADYVFQCAAATTPTAAVEDLYRVHVTGAMNLLRAAAEFTPKAVLVLLGSAAEYGVVDEVNLPVHEDQPLNPASFFGASKAAQTQLAFAAAVEWNLRVNVARPFNLLGPESPDHYLAAALAKRLLREGPTTQPFAVANAEATRDFVDVRDAAAALVAIAQRAAAGPGCPRVFNIASGQETTVRAIAEKLCELHGGRSVVPLGATGSRSRITRSCGAAAQLRQATGWQPRIAWSESLRDLWDELRQTATIRERPLLAAS